MTITNTTFETINNTNDKVIEYNKKRISPIQKEIQSTTDTPRIDINNPSIICENSTKENDRTQLSPITTNDFTPYDDNGP